MMNFLFDFRWRDNFFLLFSFELHLFLMMNFLFWLLVTWYFLPFVLVWTLPFFNDELLAWILHGFSHVFRSERVNEICLFMSLKFLTFLNVIFLLYCQVLHILKFNYSCFWTVSSENIRANNFKFFYKVLVWIRVKKSSRSSSFIADREH